LSVSGDPHARPERIPTPTDLKIERENKRHPGVCNRPASSAAGRHHLPSKRNTVDKAASGTQTTQPIPA